VNKMDVWCEMVEADPHQTFMLTIVSHSDRLNGIRYRVSEKVVVVRA